MQYFLATRRLGSYYWTGLQKVGNAYFWPDGSLVNNGATSNTDPCESCRNLGVSEPLEQS